jgi:hypothetical protein
MKVAAKEETRFGPGSLDAGDGLVISKMDDERVVRTVQLQSKDAVRRCLLATRRILNQYVAPSDTPIG